MTAAVLLSGGMDSIALTYWKRPSLALTIDYGQRPAAAEVDAASEVCLELAIEHEVIRIDCSHLGSGSLASTPPSVHAPVPEWWPYRNQLLITLAAMRVLDRGVSEILFGTVRGDDSHADGRPRFFKVITELLQAQEGGLLASAPAIELTTVDLIRKSGVPPSILGWAHSCHVANLACGTCRGCLKHYLTTSELGWFSY